MKEIRMPRAMRLVLLVALVAGIAAAARSELPALRRYLKMERM